MTDHRFNSTKHKQAQLQAPKIINGRDLAMHRHGLSGSLLGDFYYRVMVATWLQFFFAAVLVYLLINAGFALIYFFSGDVIVNARPRSFIDAYIFSFQTSTTIGYGYLLPKNGPIHAIVMIDVFSGLIFVAVMTGLVFSRLAKPRAGVMFSDRAVFTRHEGHDAIMVRLANGRRHSSIVNAGVKAAIVMADRATDSRLSRRFHDLRLERDHVPIFSLTWTLIHLIDEDSPLFGLDQQDIKELGVMLVVTLDGIEDSFAQTVHSHRLYGFADFSFNKRFVDIFDVREDGSAMIDYTRFNQIENLDSE